MSVSSVSSAFTDYARKLTGAASTGAKPSSISSALQEANETAQQTAKEAANGDTVAIAKLHKLEQQHQQSQASEPGKGEAVDAKA